MPNPPIMIFKRIIDEMPIEDVKLLLLGKTIADTHGFDVGCGKVVALERDGNNYGKMLSRVTEISSEFSERVSQLLQESS